MKMISLILIRLLINYLIKLKENKSNNDEFLSIKITSLGLMNRTVNVLHSGDIYTVLQLIENNPEELKRMRGVGKKVIEDIKCAMNTLVFKHKYTGRTGHITGEYVDKSLGDKLAHGTITPKKIDNSYNSINKNIYYDLVKNADILERYFREVQDIEFVNDGEQTYFVQTRNAQLTPLARIKTLIDLFNDGYISLSYFKDKYNPELHKKVTSFDVYGGGHLLRGTPAVNGIFTGVATFKKETAKENNILIVDSTSPDDMPYLQNVGALITKIGGMTSHPAVVCRQMNKPCIVGVSSLNFEFKHDDYTKERIYYAVNFKNKGNKQICEGDEITVIGDTGDVYEGKCEVKQKQLFVDEVNQILNSNG